MESERSKNLRRMLSPRHVAFIGGHWAISALERCARFGFQGQMWLVNPRLPETDVGEVFAAVEDLPEGPDATYLAVSSEKAVDSVGRLAAIGAGGCICFAAGFSEKGGDGVALENDLTRAAGDMALVGPNCYGMLDCRTGLHLWSGDVLDRLQGSGIGLISQSGALAEFLTMPQRSVPFASIVSVGNQAMVTLEEIAEAMVEDEGINVIGIYIEGIKDIARFSRMAAAAAAANKPVVVIKVGRTKQAAQVTLGHTSSLAGTPEFYDALFERLGVVRVDTLAQFLETIKLLSILGPLPGGRLAAITVSGGEAAMIADYAAQIGLTLPALNERQIGALKNCLPDVVNIMNPFDMTVFVFDDAELLKQTFDIIARGDFDVVVAMMETYPYPGAPFAEIMQTMIELFCETISDNNVAGIAAGVLPETLPESISQPAIQAGIAPMHGLEEMMSSIQVSARFGEFYRSLTPGVLEGLPLPVPPRHTGNLRTLDEPQSKKWLSQAGVPTPGGKVVTPAKAAAASQAIGFPVAIKVVDAELLHKTEEGAVALSLKDSNDVAAALSQFSKKRPLSRVLVEPMIEDVVVELIIGVKYDAAFGHALVIGAGGVLVELLADAVTLLLPTTREAVARGLDDLRVSTLINGFRGNPPGDKAAVIDTVLALADRVMRERNRVVEVDINPLMVLRDGSGVVAGDALVRLCE